MIAGPIQIDIISGSVPHPPPGMPWLAKPSSSLVETME